MSRNLVVLTCALGVCGIAARSISRAADQNQPAAGSAAKPAEPADAKSGDKARGDAAPQEKVTLEKALEQSVSFDYAEVPLKDVIDLIKVRCGVAIYLDHKALAEASIPEDRPITFSLSGIPLRSALRYMLNAIDLTYIVDHDVLLITTEEKAKVTVTTRVCDIRDFLAAESSLGGFDDSDSAIVKAISTCVAPETWSAGGGTGSLCLVPAAQSIVVTQSGEVHEKITQLLADLRADLPAGEKAAQTDHSPTTRIYRLLSPASGGDVASADAERYVAAIRRLIEPKSWTDESTYLGAMPGAIAVRNTLAVQARVKRLLEELGAISKEGGGMFVGPTVLKPDFGAPADTAAPPSGKSVIAPSQNSAPTR